MESNLCICLLAFDCHYEIEGNIRLVKNDYYTDSAKRIVLNLKNHDIKNIMVMTNKPQKFNGLEIDVIEYQPINYSFADKLTVCYEALKKYDTIIYMDSDCEIRYDEIKNLNIKEGISIRENWGWEDYRVSKFLDFKDKIKTNYFENIENYCLKNNLQYNDADLIEERLITIKKTDKLNDFFNLYFKLKPIIEENDLLFKNHPIGRGEGLAMGISILNSGIKYNGISKDLEKLALNHLPYNQHIKNNLKAIFVNWTKPFFYKKDAQGYNKLKLSDMSDDEYNIIDFEILIQKVAVLRAKKHIGKTKLYTDTIGYQFYDKMGMLDLWDEIDTETLDNFDKENNDISAGIFWTTGKSIVVGKQTEPFIFLDNDFIIRGELPNWIFDYDLVHTHWEILRGEYFVTNRQIEEIGGVDDFVQNMLMPNTSFLYVNNTELCEDYLSKHLSIIKRKYEHIPEWLWLLADQGIMGYSARKLNIKVETLENLVYVLFPETDTEKVGCGLFWVKNPTHIDHENLNYDHIWFSKFRMKTDEEYKLKRMDDFENELNILINERKPISQKPKVKLI